MADTVSPAAAPTGPQQGRSTGKCPVGRLRIGQIVNPNHTQRASIPSKFETILNTGNREKDGFLRRTHRFDDAENDLPGPGAYERKKQATLVKDPAGAYTSKRGTGGFASKDKRFFDMPRPLFVTPGPGNYEARVEAGAAAMGPAVQRGTPGFALSGTGSAKRPVPPSPGPGSYDVNSPSHAKSAGVAAVFKSRVGRATGADGPTGRPLSGAAGAGPGEYHDAIVKHRSIAGGVQTVLERAQPVANPLDPDNPRPPPPVGNAVFRSTTDREGHKKWMKDTPLDPQNLPPIPGMPSGLQGVGLAPAPPTMEGTSIGGTRESSMFANKNLDRFGKSVMKYTPAEGVSPGPGAYDTGSNRQAKRLLINSSWAMSGVSRFEPKGDKVRPPGPAFYTPNMGGKQSFHLNSQKVWR